MQDLQTIVQVNVQSMVQVRNVSKCCKCQYVRLCLHVQMTRIVLPGMEARKRGIIVNLSSALQDVAFPTLILYAATKVYNYDDSPCMIV